MSPILTAPPSSPPRAILPRSILLVRLGAIGDVVNALVVASAIRRHDPTVTIGWAVHDLSRPLVERHPSVDRVHAWRKGTGLAGFRALLREIREAEYELAIDLQRLAKSAAIARWSGAERVLGFDRRRTKESSWLLTRERIAAGDPGSHRVEQYLELARHLGIEAREPIFELPPAPEAAARAERIVTELGSAPIAIHVGATKPANRWEPERFGELARALLERFGTPVCLTGGPSDRESATVAAGADPRIRDLCGATTLLELAELQRRSRLVISCDSGPMHLAAAAGATVIALFGPSDERRTGPWGPRHVVVRTSPECAPCGAKQCSQPRHHCMLDLTVERVLAAVESKLAR
jgi:lipopolysaccharide heptosyltransferase II